LDGMVPAILGLKKSDVRKEQEKRETNVSNQPIATSWGNREEGVFLFLTSCESYSEDKQQNGRRGG